MTNGSGRFGLPREGDDSGGNGQGGEGQPGRDSPFDPGRGASGPTPHEEILLQIRGVQARESDEAGWYEITLDTTRGEITLLMAVHEGSTGVAIFLGGASGGHRGPAGDLYVRLGEDLARGGISAVRVVYRDPGELEECVADAMAACSFLKAFGAVRAVFVGHSFGGAVAVKAGELTPLSAAVCAMSTQRYGTYEVERLGKPLLLIHGSRDEILDKAASEDVYARALEPKQLVILEGDGHGLMEHRDQVFDLVRAFVTLHAGEPAPA